MAYVVLAKKSGFYNVRPRQLNMRAVEKVIDYTDHGFIHITLVAVAGLFSVITFVGTAMFG